MIRGYCDGLVVYRYVYEAGPEWDSDADPETIIYPSQCGVTYSSVLQAIDNRCADWATASELYQCRASPDSLGVYADFPDNAKTHYAPLSMCSFTGGGTGTGPDMSKACCGGMCADWIDPNHTTLDVKWCPPLDGTADPCSVLGAPQADAAARECYGERGACCIAGECHDFVRQKDCLAAGGTYHSGAHCCDGSTHPQICVDCS